MSSSFDNKSKAISAMERVFQTRDFQAMRIRDNAKKSMQIWRENAMAEKEQILERLVEVSKRDHGGSTSWISENTIKKDSVLILNDVKRLFGNVRNVKRATREKINGTYAPEEPNPLGSLITNAKINAAEEEKKAKAKTRAVEREEEKKAARKRGEKTLSKRKGGPGRHRTVKPDEELWQEIMEKARALGRVPNDIQIKEDPNLSSPNTYIRYLGKGYKAKIMADLAAEGIMAKAISKKSASKKPIKKKAPVKQVKESKIQTKTQEEVLTIPIQLSVPQGIKGTITLTLEF